MNWKRIFKWIGAWAVLTVVVDLLVSGTIASQGRQEQMLSYCVYGPLIAVGLLLFLVNSLTDPLGEDPD